MRKARTRVAAMRVMSESEILLTARPFRARGMPHARNGRTGLCFAANHVADDAKLLGAALRLHADRSVLDHQTTTRLHVQLSRRRQENFGVRLAAPGVFHAHDGGEKVGGVREL